jgi:hypothetical protein
MELQRTRSMSSIPDLLGAATTLVMFGLVVAAVMKLFQLASDVRELKDVLQDIRRNTQGSAGLPAASALGISGPPTPEELVRAVHSQSFGDDFPL